MSIILGINAYHSDSSACIIVNGKLIAAIEEERIRRIKHWAGFPSKSIEYCLSEANIKLRDIDFIAINQSQIANNWRRFFYLLKNKIDFSYILNRLRHRHKRSNLSLEFKKAFPSDTFVGKFIQVEHHLAHMVSAHTVSPFKQSTVVSIDGFGDFASTAWGIGAGNKIDINGRIYFPHSLGIFYMAMTQYLGFPNWGDEYKVMGLAPYGNLKYTKEVGSIIKLLDNGEFRLNLKFFSHYQDKNKIEWLGEEPKVLNLFTLDLEKLLGPARKKDDKLTQKHMDIARSVQFVYETVFFNLLNKLYDKHGLKSLSLAGGCAMNSVANGKIIKKTPYTHIYVQAASGDAGGAIGAAFHVYSNKNQGSRKYFEMDHAYWGPSYTNSYHKNLLDRNLSKIEKLFCSIEYINDENQLCDKVADAIAKGLVIGWFQGRMEWGPRALGNRSILGDPRRENMKDILNLKIKRRESFRPFAPSILLEKVYEWFENDAEVPFMSQVFQIREDKKKKIPAVTHVDGSGRLQTVSLKNNPLYYKLISAFADKTGIPILLNTSFNENEPIVCSPEEALETFFRTKMDLLVLGNWIVKRK